MNNNRNNNNRRRGRNNRNQGGANSGNRIDSRARGNAPQLLDKYKKLAQDAQHNGDRVQTEYYLQFADHYFRVIADNKARQDEARGNNRQDRDDRGADCVAAPRSSACSEQPQLRTLRRRTDTIAAIVSKTATPPKAQSQELGLPMRAPIPLPRTNAPRTARPWECPLRARRVVPRSGR